MPGGRGRGGRRQGLPGKSYTNRSDLQTKPRQATQPIRVVPSQTYGEGIAQRAAQQAIPLPAAPPPLSAPTARPNEPVTAGLPTGAGPGPAAVTRPLQAAALDADQSLEAQLRGLYLANPNSDIARLIAQIQARKQPQMTTPSPSRRQPGTPMQRGPFKFATPPGATQQYYGGDNMPSINPNSGETGSYPEVQLGRPRDTISDPGIRPPTPPA